MVFWMNIYYGLIAGLVYGLSGYLSKVPRERFDFPRLIVSAIVGVAAGMVAGFFGINIDDLFSRFGYTFDKIVEIILTIGFVFVIDKTVKFGYRLYAAKYYAKKK